MLIYLIYIINNHLEIFLFFAYNLHYHPYSLNTGWIIKMGRGLDMFKPVRHGHIGINNCDLRKCLRCEIDIYYNLNNIY